VVYDQSQNHNQDLVSSVNVLRPMSKISGFFLWVEYYLRCFYSPIENTIWWDSLQVDPDILSYMESDGYTKGDMLILSKYVLFISCCRY